MKLPEKTLVLKQSVAPMLALLFGAASSLGNANAKLTTFTFKMVKVILSENSNQSVGLLGLHQVMKIV